MKTTPAQISDGKSTVVSKKKWITPHMEVIKVNSGIVILPIEILGVQGPS